MEERLEFFDDFYEFLVSVNPSIPERKDVNPAAKRLRLAPEA
jgi:hypothetical protein